MTLFLRNDKNQTLVDIELWIKKEELWSYVEISCSIDIIHYSELLIKTYKESKHDASVLILTFDELSEIRGWLWNVYFQNKKNTEYYYDEVLAALKKILEKYSKQLNLNLIID